MNFSPRVPIYPCTLFFSFWLAFGLGHGALEEKPFCGFLYSQDNFTGDVFDIKQESSYTNLEETYVSTDLVWNVTNSFKVQGGCLLTACNESYFDGLCKEYTEDSPLLSEGFDTIMSANCTCAANCLCTDVYMRKTSCARGYISKGCNTCNAFYTDFKGSKAFVPEDFKDKIASIIVRKGCTLTLYDEEDYEGESLTLEAVIKENWESSIGSYECVCDEAATEEPKRPRPPNSPPFIDIPSSADNISALLNTELGDIPNIGKHPGLVAALRSIKGKRSPRNAYILLIGLTGAGKSSAVNLLFDNPNVTRVGEDQSTTSDIHEFRIPVPVDYLGIRNSELRVIDTPGLGDTRGLEQDAKFLATLEDFLNGHEELSKRIPNIVLVFGKFHDNRFAGDGATFVKMLRGVDSFRERITDKKFSNVIFVFSHFMSETKAIRRRPGTRLQSFKKVIEDYSLFPKPISIVVAENKAGEQELQMLNGYYKLPNGDFYPRNLFEKIEFATVNGNDPIGEAVIRTAFSDSDEFNITSSTHLLVSSQHSKVIKYLSELSGAHFNPDNTEVSIILATAYETLDVNLRKKFPDALPYLQRSFNIRNILTKADIPKTTYEIVKFMKDIKQNEAVLYLMDKAFGLRAPTLKENVITGYGYNVMEDRPLPISPFKLGELRNTDIGYMIPNIMTCNVESSSTGIFKVFGNREEYLKSRLESLNVEGAIPVESFKGEIQPGSNIIGGSEAENDTRTEISAVKEHRTFELVLNDRLDLTTQFVNTVKNLTAYNESDYDSVESWTRFFNDYGTHVVKSTHGGGSIEIRLTSNKTFGPEIAQAMFNIIEFAEDVTIGRVSNTSFEVEGTQHHLIKFRGGDHKYHATDLKSMSLTEAADLLENWKESLILNPAILVTDMRLLPISEVAKKIGQSYSAEIQTAALALFNSTLKYQAKQRNNAPPPDRIKTGQDYQQSHRDFSMFFEGIMEQNRRSDEKFQEMMKIMQENTNKQMEIREQQRQEDLKWQREQQAALVRQRQEDREMEKARLQESERRHKAEMERQKEESDRLQIEQRNHQIQLESMRQEADRRQSVLQAELLAEARKPKKSSCLKKGTHILVADAIEKPVETLRIGDTILDGNLKPTRVLGVTAWFLFNQDFYGFEKDNYFFTATHLLVGRDNSTGETQFHTVSPQDLYDVNPLLEYLPIQDMKSEFSIFKYTQDQKETHLEKVSVLKDSLKYPEETLVYFIQVDSPEGTYIANGYVCRHEFPPVEYWPKTMALLYSIFYYPEARIIAHINYTMESIEIINRIVDDIYYKMEEVLRKVDYVLEDEQDKEILLQNFEEKNVVSDIFGQPTFTTFAVGLYARTANDLADRLDLDLTYNGKVGTLQKLLREVAVEVIRKHNQSAEFQQLLQGK